MPVCKTCGKKYSEWISLVNTHGVCGDCFESGLSQERKAESQVDVAPAPVTAAPLLERDADSRSEQSRPRPHVPADVFVETLAVTLVFFGGRILLGWLEPISKA